MVNTLSACARAAKAVGYWWMIVAVWFMAALFFLSVADVGGRYLFNHPIVGTLEVSEILLLGIVFFGSAYTLNRDKHVTMELLYARLSVPAKRGVDIATRVLSLALFVLMTWRVTEVAFYFKATNRLVPTLFWPMYPFVLFVSVGTLLLCMELIVQIVFLISGRPYYEDQG